MRRMVIESGMEGEYSYVWTVCLSKEQLRVEAGMQNHGVPCGKINKRKLDPINA